MSPRRIAVRLLTAVVVAAGLAGLSAPAALAADTINALYTPNGVSPTSNVGLVSVSIESTTPLTSLTVSIYTIGTSYCNGTDKLDLGISQFVKPTNDGNSQYGTWTLSVPINTGQLALGDYQVCVTAADSGGGSLPLSYIGPLYFFNIVEFPTFNSSGTSFNYDNQDVTLSGVAEELTPDGTTTPFASKTLTVPNTGNTPVTTVTGADGSFSVKFQVLGTGPYWVYYSNDGSTYGSSPPITLTLNTFPVKISAKLTATHVNQGKPVSVNGTVTYNDNGTQKPLAGNTVVLCSSGDPYPCDSAFASYASGTAVTDASGKFTMKVPTTGSDTWTVQTTATIYFPTAKTTLPLTVALANAITGFKASVDSFATITYSGCLTSGSSGVAIEYAAKSTGRWYRLKVKPVITGTLCTQGSHYGYVFSGTTTAVLAAAYYRAVYAATPQWQAAVSRTLFVWKYLTKITSFKVSPRSVASGGKIRVSGRLWTEVGHGNRWQPYGHRHVLVIFRYKGVWYRYNSEPLTSRAGWFSGRFPVLATSPIFSQYNGDKGHFACASVRIKVTLGAAAALQYRLRVPEGVLRVWRISQGTGPQ